ncbi:hypothetical protein BGZ88_003680 [Linnemannia elongata]|nr:hypothetical protein BGZ88_003680 [Linnemannia elongata]
MLEQLVQTHIDIPQPFIWREEELRLQKAISEQFSGKYQVAVDALVGKPATTVNVLENGGQNCSSSRD